MRASPRLCLAALALVTACRTAAPAPPPVGAADPAAVVSTLWLIGDAGGARPEDPVLRALRASIAKTPDRSVVVFLGDNVYPRGLPDSGAATVRESRLRLDAQLAASSAASRVYFVPGNHDWDRHGADGWNAIRRQERYIAGHSDARLLPTGGCPGPETVDIGARLRLVFLDTQWWLHAGPRPQDGSACRADTPAEIGAALRASLADADGRRVIVVAHHPLVSGGPHGGHFGWRDHLFPLRRVASWLWVPLPLLGSAYPVARMLGVSSQDLAGGSNRRMRELFDSAFVDHPPLVYAAGHEHALELHRGTVVPFVLVSGAGTWRHASDVGREPATLFARGASGFMRLDLLHDGRVRLGVLVADGLGGATEVYSLWLS